MFTYELNGCLAATKQRLLQHAKCICSFETELSRVRPKKKPVRAAMTSAARNA
jgi:hypothetical protein